ncbi:MAG: hypothetical protein JWR45_2255, partial [Blastococcus sp.]|nr:hypothetical protein [Blastococcus sp.]
PAPRSPDATSATDAGGTAAVAADRRTGAAAPALPRDPAAVGSLR